MDWIAIRNRGKDAFGKYKYVLLVLFLGVILMVIPEKGEPMQFTEETQTQELPGIAEQLEQILAQIDGVGRVEVLITEHRGAQSIYKTDEDSTSGGDSGSIRSETVIIQNADRSEAPLLERVDPPVYLGAVVVCQGAERPSVRLQVVEAVASVTGIGTDRISVLKMK